VPRVSASNEYGWVGIKVQKFWTEVRNEILSEKSQRYTQKIVNNFTAGVWNGSGRGEGT
jgi:hypothetical protein